MMKEIKVAARWWASQISRIHLSSRQIKLFETELQRRLFAKYKGHWYNHDPLRGHAYRSILFDPSERRIEDILLEAAQAAQILEDFEVVLQSLSKGVIMWVDPCSASRRRDSWFRVGGPGSSGFVIYLV
eukprot:TRINITY_DN1243_c0_g1_i2.p1 TRINITY_DN1243_c0_g1~~TRINITY_DN1243_c0_g1_i2.p1  ORF type:complete len:129 (-),score=17.66 TRINITY_DN1243_c0_g1_i2:45-431(-)